jgi:Gram-negative bacterial TonB protein C-terminal
MADSNIKNIQLSFQCPQNWDAMRLCDGGKFCSTCQKTVFDFTDKNQTDFDIIYQQFNGQICGRFRQSQLNFAKITAMAGLFLASNTELIAQNITNQAITPNKDSSQLTPKRPEMVFGMVELMPKYKDGEKAFFQFIHDNLKYPSQDCVDGTVYIGFTIGIDGQVKNLTIKRGIKNRPEYGLEALRVIQLTSGKWKPGEVLGNIVETPMIMPIKFRLE